MAELVAGAFLSSFLQVAFEKLASHDFHDYFRRKKLDESLLRNLEVTLLSVDKIVEDAEERQYKDHRVKQWLHHLKDEVFNAQDLLDDITTETLQHKLHAESQTSLTGKVRGYLTSSVKKNKFGKEIESGIRQVLENLEYLVKQNEVLGLKERLPGSLQLSVDQNAPKRAYETLLIDERDVYGRDADKESIVDILLSPNMGGNQLPLNVIAIIGMGGMGKTTLARLVYEDVRLKDPFEHRAWVCVSEPFDVEGVTKAIIHSLDCPTNELRDFHSCQLKLKDTLMGKKFFLVLDDVWNEDYNKWDVFQTPLKYAAPQSKIIVTTRNSSVAKVLCCDITYPLKPLQDGDCWNLFEKYAFKNQHLARDPDFVQVGGEILKKCGGLPLAIKTLGTLLHTRPTYQEWDKILRSDVWQLPQNDSHIIPSLRLSYHYLPSKLKRCFAYCSIFPKDYEINKDVIVQLWMADGLIYPPQKGMSLEEVGNEFFNDLLSRSFFESSSRNGYSHFIMHDLLNDLAKSVAGEFFVQLDVDHAKDVSTKTRFFSCITNNQFSIEGVGNFEKIFKCDRLRSFLVLETDLFHGLPCDIMSSLSRLKYLRELSLYGFRNIVILTDAIGNLKHLHYLDLSYTSVKKLPNSMCSLINLQTLKLWACFQLTELPSNFYKLINLRHLDLESCGLMKMPKHMGKLNQLRTMNRFIVGKKEEGGSNIKELGALNNLTGSLTISNMESINDVGDMREANLKEKKLVTLKLLYNREEGQHQDYILEALEPNQNVKHLTVEYYGGTQMTKFIATGGLHDLVSLVLDNCYNCGSLPPLGQLPSLQRLKISEFDRIKVVGEEFYGKGSLGASFPCLSYLEFSIMPAWEEWDVCYESQSFPRLEHVYIYYCPRLKKSLPQHFPCLKTLEIRDCENLEATLPKSSFLENLCLDRCGKIRAKDMLTLSSSHPSSSSSLQRLSIKWCPKLIASGREWGLHELLSLKELNIWGDIEDGREAFPEERLLPSNLQSLSFKDCPKMKRINHRGLAHLHSLTSLSFDECPIMSFEGMPQHALPPSLSHLDIEYGCPLLEERCEKEKGPDWPLISHIPHVSIM